MKVELKPIIEALKHDGNQLEHHARKLRTISPNLEAEAQEIDDKGGVHQKADRDFGTVGIATNSRGPLMSYSMLTY